MQKAIIVNANNGAHELNLLLDNGWKVINTCPMTSSGAGQGYDKSYPTCLVIIEKLSE